MFGSLLGGAARIITCPLDVANAVADVMCGNRRDYSYAADMSKIQEPFPKPNIDLSTISSTCDLGGDEFKSLGPKTKHITEGYKLEHPSDGEDLAQDRLDLWQQEIDVALRQENQGSVNKTRDGEAMSGNATNHNPTERNIMNRLLELANIASLISTVRKNKKASLVVLGVTAVAALGYYAYLALNRGNDGSDI